MKKLILLGLLLGVFVFNACKDDDEITHETEYHIQFMEPANNASLAVGDMLNVHVEFSEHNDGTVHHINVRAYNKATGTELFSSPAEAHVHGASPYSFQFQQSLAGVATGTYVIEAKVWGLNAGVAEVTASREFTVN